MSRRSVVLPTPRATQALGEALAPSLGGGMAVHLHGELGTGKTSLARALLRAFGVSGAVRSPTYTLIEPYPLPAFTAYHLDLYRLSDPEELEAIGLRDLLGADGLLLVEWPERGAGVLPAADFVITLSYAAAGRVAELNALAPGAVERLDSLTFQERKTP